MHNVLDFSADPTGVSPSDAAFAAAIAAAAAEGNHLNRWGDTVIVPSGTYRIDNDLDVYGGVVLQGTGPGTQLVMGTGAIIILHSQASGPVWSPVAGKLVGFDVRGLRPTFVPWAPDTGFSEGQCVRIPGDNHAHFECVQQGRSGAAAPTGYCAPELSRVWTAHNTVGDRAVRRSSDGDLLHYYVSEDAGTTGRDEPRWNTAEDAITPDGTVMWRTLIPASPSSKSYYWLDGTCIWRTRYHTGVLVQSGHVEACLFYNFANFGVTVMASVGYLPYSNANGWHVLDCFIGTCGGGVYVHGSDANAGICQNVRAVGIGYEGNGTDPIPYPGSTSTPREKRNSGGIGFWDNSYLGNTWIGCMAETCEGRGFYGRGDDEANPGDNAWSTFIGCYTELNCAPNYFSPLCSVAGGIQAAGFEPYRSGLYLTRLRLRPTSCK